MSGCWALRHLTFISQKVFVFFSCKFQFPEKSVNLSLIVTNIPSTWQAGKSALMGFLNKVETMLPEEEKGAPKVVTPTGVPHLQEKAPPYRRPMPRILGGS